MSNLAIQPRPAVALFAVVISGALAAGPSASAEPGSPARPSAAEVLFNGRDLSGWERYLGVEEVPSLPFDICGSWPPVIGRGVDTKRVFSVVERDGHPAIRISGEVWGALISDRTYRNYRLRLEYQWGDERHPPRAEAPRNTGLLYHSVGPDGAFWSYWMRSAEFEIMEGHTGDFTSVDGVGGSTATEWDRSSGYPWKRYAADGSATVLGGLTFRVAARADFEHRAGEWNQLDLWVYGASAVHQVNGETVFAVDELSHEVAGKSVPLVGGAIQLQSEGAEVFFRNISLQPLDSIEPLRAAARQTTNPS